MRKVALGHADIARVTDVAVFAFIVVLWERLAAVNGSGVASFVRRLRPGRNLTYAGLAALPFLLLCQVALLAFQSRYDNTHAGSAWLKEALPLPVFDGDHGSAGLNPFSAALGFGIGACETLALGVVLLGLADGVAIGRRAVAGVVAALAFVSLTAPVMSTTDPYEYVATGLLRFAAYAPPHDAFVGSIYAPIDRFIPLRGVIYGPLWVLVDIVQTSFGSTIVQKIEALRVTNLAFVLALVQVLRACRVSRAVVIAVALNPVVWFYTVANPHADIQGLLLLAAAFYFARRSNVAFAMLCVVAAGLIKLPYVVIGGVMLSPLRGGVLRVAAWCGAVALVLAVSSLVQGHAYVHDVSKFAVVKSEVNRSNGWLLMLPVVVAAVFAMLAFRKGAAGIALLFSQAGPIAAPWYLYWGLPYALVSGAGEAYLAGIPLLATLREDTFALMLFAVKKALVVLLVGALIVDQVWLRRRRAATARLQISTP
ncbi:MAG: hypothetical protein NVS3B16_07240 [Vulcanimicrobiaceae bacterium]